MTSNDDSAVLLRQVADAAENGVPLAISGGNSKAHLGNAADGSSTPLSTLNHCGVVSYEPTELVVTVRSGTRLVDLNRTLAEAGQMLPFEPPELPGGTIGGVIACGLSGPRRPFMGSARDYVLGTRLINGRAQDLSFGGEVMKNVAGYDVSRLQVGAFGTLGVLLDISMKVLPVPQAEKTLRVPCESLELASIATLMRQPHPLSGIVQTGQQRYIRLSGSLAAVDAAVEAIGGDVIDNADAPWNAIRDFTHPFFSGLPAQAVWRISVADHAPALPLAGEWLFDWAGAVRWLKTDESSVDIMAAAAAAGGHATRYGQAIDDEPAFQPLTGPMARLQARVRESFDPQQLLNRGRFQREQNHASLTAVGV